MTLPATRVGQVDSYAAETENERHRREDIHFNIFDTNLTTRELNTFPHAFGVFLGFVLDTKRSTSTSMSLTVYLFIRLITPNGNLHYNTTLVE